MSAQGSLYLIPVPVSDSPIENCLPEYNLQIVRGLRKFICENAKECRRFLKKAGYPVIQEAQILELNVHSKTKDTDVYRDFILGENSVGLMSDAGCPGIADPGALVVALAHRNGIRVVPLVGPSAVVLSIMASGFNGQNFAFNGYLPIDKQMRVKQLRELELKVQKEDQAQFFIETPYRNTGLMEQLLASLHASTKVFVGRNLMGENALLMSKTVFEWKKSKVPDMSKVPVVFGIYR